MVTTRAFRKGHLFGRPVFTYDVAARGMSLTEYLIATAGEDARPVVEDAETLAFGLDRLGMAEGVGFEPTIQFPVYTLSKRAP
jgi:hypothetical protein